MYSEIIKKFLTLPKGRGQTFDAVQRLDQKLEFPHRSYRLVHVGGTNGKGSVAAKIAKGLELEGFRVGLFTSPHISSVRERIQINGEMIEEECLEEHLRTVLGLADPSLSFFDLITAVAFLYFQKIKVDWVVCEVGLGGRLDATNVIDPELAVITSIGFDHMEILGDTLEKIAKEKGGIAKKGVPLIVGPSAAPFFPQAFLASCQGGFYDIENGEIASLALRYLKVSEKSIRKSILFRPKCRFELIENTILDAAHNPNGFNCLAAALEAYFPNEKFHFIVAFSQGKEWAACLDIIRPLAAQISFVNTHPRFVPLGGGSVRDALGRVAFRQVICGSFYLMAEARRALGLLDPSDPE